jgi:hypothetical protein
MDRRLSVPLVLALCVASMLAACGSNTQVTTPSTEIRATPASPGPTAPLLASPSPSVSPTPTLPSPTEQATPTTTPSAVPEVTYAPAPQPSIARAGPAAPAIPTRVGLSYPSEPCTPLNQDEGCSWLRVAWHEANPSGVTVRVYAVTECLHSATAANPNAKCMVNGDMIPKAALLLLGTAPASARSFSFMLAEDGGEGNFSLGSLPGHGPDVQTIVLQAINSQGGSLAAIVATSPAGCFGCIL